MLRASTLLRAEKVFAGSCIGTSTQSEPSTSGVLKYTRDSMNPMIRHIK